MTPDDQARAEPSPRPDALCRALGDRLHDPPPGPEADPGATLADADAAHVAGCASCEAVRAAYARLDALLAAEPAPAAPADLARAILAAVARRRARDLAWARRQALVLVAAAAAAVVGLALAAGGVPAPGALAAAARGLLDASVAVVGGGLALLPPLPGPGDLAPDLPAPPLVVVAALAPALLLLDRLVCRSPR
ncbi:MAG: hypothetical protein M9894_06410 [Planctomycetes bacterium]|nr:hypothetical protein [Planctomycetota bacterium]